MAGKQAMSDVVESWSTNLFPTGDITEGKVQAVVMYQILVTLRDIRDLLEEDMEPER